MDYYCVLGNPVEHSNLLYALNFMSGYDAKKLFAEHVEWGRRHADALTRGMVLHRAAGVP